MESMGVIEPSDSCYRSPSVMVGKPDGSNRYCIDFRRINAITQFDAEPIPNPDMVINSIGSDRYITKCDLIKGFWQIPMKASSKKYTAFSTEVGLKQFKYMPFGMVNASSVFCRMVRKLLDGIENVESFIDDIIIHNSTWDDHLLTVRLVLERLRKHGLTARPSKFEFGCMETKLLGHVVGDNKVKPQAEKIVRILGLKRPKTKKELRSFMGMVGYYQKFIPKYSDIAHGLTGMVCKSKPNILVWDENSIKAFNELRTVLSKEPILKLPDINKPFILCVDASDVGIGVH